MRTLNKTQRRAACVSLLATALAAGACSDINVPDYNRAGTNDLVNNPNKTLVDAASLGLIQNARRDAANRTRLAGIVGREAYYLDPNESRYTTELVTGAIDPSSFAGNHDYLNPYGTIAQGQLILTAVDAVAPTEYTAAQKEGIRGFALTMMGNDLLIVAALHQYGPTEVPNNPLDPPAPMKTQAEMYTQAAKYLDDALPHLAAAGSSFSFGPMPSGFSGFTSPANFTKFNRALRVRLDILRKDYAGAITHLPSTFLNAAATTRAQFNTGVYYTYSNASGDLQNGLNSGSPEVAEPTLRTQAQLQASGLRDQRFLDKVDSTGSTQSRASISSNLRFRMYGRAGTSLFNPFVAAANGQSAPIPWIRNEELLLDRAEARWATGDKAGATADLNQVRVNSGKLDPIAQPADDASWVTALLYERRYSLMYEGGHRWFDLRRFDKLATLNDYPRLGDRIPTYFPVPFIECLARGGSGSAPGCP